MLGDVASGVGLVERDHITERLEFGRGKAREFAAARGAEAISEHEIRPAAALIGNWTRWHGVAVDQHGEAECVLCREQEVALRLMIGRIEPVDALERGAGPELLAAQ